MTSVQINLIITVLKYGLAKPIC